MKRLLFIFIFALCAVILSVPHARLAFTIGTGIGLDSLQKQINGIQTRAIKNQITSRDKDFLVRFYRTLAYGAQLTFVLPESARLMHHYLDGSGAPTQIDKSLYTESARVIDRMETIKKHLTKNCKVGTSRTSSRFDMGHGYPLDAHFALYFGTIKGTITENKNATMIRWEVKMPWKWPTYADIKRSYGTYYKEIIPFPKALSLLGLGEPMYLPNGLGGELEIQGLAKPFEINTSWNEKLNC